MNLSGRISALEKLGNYIKENGKKLSDAKYAAESNNPWFTQENINFSLESISKEMLDLAILKSWTSRYNIGKYEPKKIGLILAGNIPLVGFHDIICSFLAGHIALIKCSGKDEILTKHLIEKLSEFIPDEKYFYFVERLNEMEAVIATGSNNSANQFEKYFSKYPRIIRRNRSAIAILKGDETDDDLIALGQDVFSFFGLGCRNVSKIYIPKDFNKVRLIEIFHDHFKYLINHNKYKNNYDYNYALYLLNAEDFIATGSMILRKNSDIVSRIASLHYEEYDNIEELEVKLVAQIDDIQCIASKQKLENLVTVPFGQCQQPKIDDYADDIDTMAFLSNIQ